MSFSNKFNTTLTETQLHNYADVLLWGLKTARGNTFKKNDIVLIRFDILAINLAEILEAKLLDMNLNPVRRLNPTPTMETNFFTISNENQLTFNIPGEKELYHNLNGSIFLHAPESITHLQDVDPKNITKFAVSKKYLKDILEKREQLGLFGWTLCVLPTLELAKQAKLSINEYTNQILNACFLNHTNPVSQWESVFDEAKEVKKWLNSMKVKTFHIESENTDLAITPGINRKWIGVSGHNIPSFELFISPDWRGTNGIYYANQPSYRTGNYVEMVKLEFKNGNIINYKCEVGGEFLKKQLETDKGASRIGEFSLTDKRSSKITRFMANTLFDENYGGEFGNCHIAIGSSYSDTYSGSSKILSKELKKTLGFNESSIHWDLVNTEKKRITADTAENKTITIYEDGKFKL